MLQLKLFEETDRAQAVRADLHRRTTRPKFRRSRAAATPIPAVTDRFELFIAGREIANGFSELNDPEDQAERFGAQVAGQGSGRRGSDVLRRRLRPRARIRPAADRGEGIGIDRLVMLLTDSPTIRDVILFPQLSPEG